MLTVPYQGLLSVCVITPQALSLPSCLHSDLCFSRTVQTGGLLQTHSRHTPDAHSLTLLLLSPKDALSFWLYPRSLGFQSLNLKRKNIVKEGDSIKVVGLWGVALNLSFNSEKKWGVSCGNFLVSVIQICTVPIQDMSNRCFLYLNNLLGLVGMRASVIKLYFHILHSHCLSKIPFWVAGDRRRKWSSVTHGSAGKWEIQSLKKSTRFCTAGLPGDMSKREEQAPALMDTQVQVTELQGSFGQVA